jgi:epoxyqueuosine reductase QueG
LRGEGYKAIICDSSTGEGSIVPLKLAAIRAGLGWQGKHSLLVTKKFGTFLALGGIVTNAVLEHNRAEETNRCRKCNKCQEACPVSALKQPYVLNRAKCLSYLLQLEEPLPEEAQRVIENRVGDCELCQQACPWNKKHLENPLQTGLTNVFQEQKKTWEEFFYLPHLAQLSEEEYGKTSGYLNTGIPYNVFQRNVRIALEKVEGRRHQVSN